MGTTTNILKNSVHVIENAISVKQNFGKWCVVLKTNIDKIDFDKQTTDAAFILKDNKIIHFYCFTCCKNIRYYVPFEEMR